MTARRRLGSVSTLVLGVGLSIATPGAAPATGAPIAVGPATGATRAIADTVTEDRSALEWGIAGGALLGAIAFDRAARDELYLDSAGRLEPETRALSRFGTPRVAFPVLAAMYGVGRWTDRPRLARRAWEGAVAYGITSAATTALKIAIGRERPAHGGDPDTFRPGSGDSAFHAFPSGHTAAAFSLATTVSEAVDRPWVTVLSYGLAGSVGWSRVHGDDHWLSDVVGGAILGTVATRATLGWLEGFGESGTAIGVGPGGVAVRIPTP